MAWTDTTPTNTGSFTDIIRTSTGIIEQRELLINALHKLDIGGYRLIIRPQEVTDPWTDINREAV